MELASKSSICSFQFERTSEIQLTFFDWIEIRQRSLDEFGCKPHGEQSAENQALEGEFRETGMIVIRGAKEDCFSALL